MTHDPNVYGYVNGKPVFSRDEFIYESRRRGPIEDDAELIAFAEKATSGWHSAGWSHSFISFYLSDYALSEPFASLTLSEFGRLKELQQEAREAAKAADDARCWRLKETINWADNSFEEFVKDIIAGENRATAFRYEASPICRASFPSTLDEDDARCTVEVTVYRLNAVAVTAFLLDGPETLLRHIGLDERDTYTTKHEIDDLVTVVHITREEATAWQH